MPNASIKVNKQSIQAKLNKALAASPELKRKAYKKIEPFFKRAKAQMLKEFNRHPVTVEIENGPASSEGNISGTLQGYEEANLFAFIGFEAGSDPIEPVRELLEEGVDMKLTQFRNNKYYFRVTIPEQDTFDRIAPVPGWSFHDSWIEGIEKGFDNLEYFVWKHWEGGRSQEGFQVPYEYADGAQFQPRPYLTEILDNFKASMENI